MRSGRPELVLMLQTVFRKPHVRYSDISEQPILQWLENEESSVHECEEGFEVLCNYDSVFQLGDSDYKQVQSYGEEQHTSDSLSSDIVAQ
jgi:hypothetical protein